MFISVLLGMQNGARQTYSFLVFIFLKPYFSFFCLSCHSWNWQPVIFYIFDVFFLFFSFCSTKGPQTRHWFYFWSEADNLICKYDHLRDFIVWGEKLWSATRGLSQRGWKCLITGKCVFSSSEILKNAIFKESLTVEKLLKNILYLCICCVWASDMNEASFCQCPCSQIFLFCSKERKDNSQTDRGNGTASAQTELQWVHSFYLTEPLIAVIVEMKAQLSEVY